MNFAKFNNFRFAYDAETLDWEKDGSRFVSLKDLYEKNGPDALYEIKSIWIREAQKDDKGNIIDGSINEENPVITIDGLHVNIPQNQLEQIRRMLNEQDVIDYVNSGLAGFSIREYPNKYRPGELCYAANWCNLDDGSHV